MYALLLFGLYSHYVQAMIYTQLSDQFDLKVEIRVNATGNPDLDSSYLRIQIIDKETKNIRQTIRKPRNWIFPTFYTNSNNSRSYSTNFNTDKPVVDDDFGDVVVADLNFDGLDDFAVTYDHGVSNGNHYYFYFQRPNHTFYRQVFLTEEMVHFPAKIDPINKRLTTITAAGCCGVGHRTFQYNVEKRSWHLHAAWTIEF